MKAQRATVAMAHIRFHDCTCVKVSIIDKFRGRKPILREHSPDFQRKIKPHDLISCSPCGQTCQKLVSFRLLFSYRPTNPGKINGKAKLCHKSWTLFSGKLASVLFKSVARTFSI